MRTIAHISDLHFGKVNRAAEQELLADLFALKPSVIAISGDITQRALRRQYSRAKAFLDQLPSPFIVIPGNHDVHADMARRFLLPFQRYKYYVCSQLSPVYLDEEICIVGVNTARSLAIESGRISKSQCTKTEKVFGGLPFPVLKIVMTHHPFVRPPHVPTLRKLVGGAEYAVRSFERSGVDLILSGHFHRTHCADLKDLYPDIRRSIIHAQAGTAISTRTNTQHNCYNVLRLDKNRMDISAREWDGSVFKERPLASYDRDESGWHAREEHMPEHDALGALTAGLHYSTY